jgi:hypothetical protein
LVYGQCLSGQRHKHNRSSRLFLAKGAHGINAARAARREKTCE